MDSKQLALQPISTNRDAGFGGKKAASRERSSLATASFRVYYSLRAGAVPFLWESTPGTPKSGGGGGATAVVSPESPAAKTVVLVSSAAAAAAADAASDATVVPLPPISPPPSYQPFQPKKGRRRCRPPGSSWPGAAGGIVRALLGMLGLRRRRRRSPHRLSTSNLSAPVALHG